MYPIDELKEILFPESLMPTAIKRKSYFHILFE